MKPTNLVAENFKGLDFNHELRAVTMFTGPNDSGKTARLDAIKISLLGYDPDVGKQPSSTFKFAGESRSDLLVHLQFDSGQSITRQSITRQFTRNPAGEVKRTTNKSDVGDIPAVLFDASDYLADTAQGRIKTVFERIDISRIAIKDEDLLASMRAIEVVPANLSKEAVEGLLAEVKALIKRRDTTKASIQSFLEDLVKTLSERQKYFKSQQELSSAQMIGYRRADKAPENVQSHIDATKSRLKELANKQSELSALLAASKAKDQRRAALKAIIDQPIGNAAELANLQTNIGIWSATVASYENKVPAASARVRSLHEKGVALTASIQAKKREIDQIDVRLTGLANEPHCPYCRSKRKGWQDEVRDELNARKFVLKSELQDLQNQYQPIIAEQADATAAEAAAKANHEKHLADAKQLNVLQNQMTAQLQSAGRRKIAEAELAGLNATPVPDASALTAIADEIANVNAVLRDLEAKQVVYNQFVTNKERSAEAEKAIISHGVRIEVYKKAVALIVTEQKNIVARAFDSLLVHARKFTDGLLPGKLEYENDELGYHSDKGWVSHEVMGGRGKLLTYVGLQVALAQQSPVKAVLVDEMGKFDARSKVQMMERMFALVDQGFIDFFVGTEPDSGPYKAIRNPNFLLVELSS